MVCPVLWRSLALASIAAVACGGRQPAPVSAGRAEADHDEEHEVERGAIPEDVMGPPKVAWSELDHRQRAVFMKRVVMPTMKPLFVAFDPKTFRDFDCTTCHVSDRDFQMPNPRLFVLPARPRQTLAADKAAWLTFMTSEVEPEMAKLLGLPEADPDRASGPPPVSRGAPLPSPALGCTSCHTQR